MFWALAILALGLLILLHEAGHFLVARLSGMRVERFSIGFGPALAKFQRGETIYQVAAIPLGGFVQIAGMNPAEEVQADDRHSFPNRPVWQRLLTIFAGPGTNYLFAMLLAIAIFASYGVPSTNPVVIEALAGKPAQKAGLVSNDVILEIDGQKVVSTHDVTRAIGKSGGRPLRLRLRRAGAELTLVVTPEQQSQGDYKIGIQVGQLAPSLQPAPLTTAVWQGIRWPFDMSVEILAGLGRILRGREKAELTGPVGIAREMKKQIEQGLQKALTIIMVLSVYLGLFNLLPIPALDGARLAFLGVEVVTRRQVNPRVEGTIHMVGFVLLLGLILLVTWKDISRIGG
jgi:regulator of sigma E protease